MTLGEIIGACVATAAIGLAVYFYLNPRDPSVRLAMGVTLDRPLLEKGPLDTHDLDLLYDGQPVAEPWLWAAQLTNTGKRPIRPSDFGGPIYFVFPNHKRLLTANAVGEGEIWAYEDEDTLDLQLGFATQIINPGESVEIVALMDGRQEPIAVEGKVAGRIISLNEAERRSSLIADVREFAVIGLVIPALIGVVWLIYLLTGGS